MKRLISAVIVLIIAFGLVGCDLFSGFGPGESQGTAATSPNADTTDPAILETDPVIEETGEQTPEPTEKIENTAIDSGIQYRINLFLSNFAEAKIRHYPCCNYHKLKFVVAHCQINGVGGLDYADGNVHFSKATADSVLNQYTGTVINETGDDFQHQDCMGSGAIITFSENFYYCPADSQDHAAYVAVADHMAENEDGTYTVRYHVYELNPAYSSYDYSAIYQYTPDEAVYDWNLSAVYQAEAVVRDYLRADGAASYQLISLTIVE